MKTHNISALIIYVLAVIAITAMLPKQRQFKYELQKGKAWQYEDLYAPFDFVVLKTNAEIKEERDNIYKHARPYFSVTSSVYPEQKIRFEQEFDRRFASAMDIVRNKFPEQQVNADTVKSELQRFALSSLEFVYSKGITNYTDVLEKDNGQGTVVLVENKMSRTVPSTEVFTVHSAQQYVADQVTIKFSNNQILLTAFDNLNIYDFIKPNIEYDKTLTTKARLALEEQLSESRGMVQAGQLIIAHNELMNDQNLRILRSLRREFQSTGVTSSPISWTLFGQTMLVAILMALLFVFVMLNYPRIFSHFRLLFFVVGLVVVMIGMMCVSIRFQIGHAYLLPFAILPLILRTFYDGHLAIIAHMVTVILCGLLISSGYEFIMLQTVAGMVAIFCLSKIAKRRQLFMAVLMVTTSYIATYTAISLLQEGQFSHIGLRPYMWFFVNGLLLFVAYPLIFIFEKVFGLVSDVTLLELSDTNHPLLRELAEKAPGTFQHVMQVANLAEDAIRNIGGNPLMARVGALYHDVGKTSAPQFFVENQVGTNPHDALSNEESAAIIIGHVKNGEELARAYKLPPRIIDFIATHHGTDVVRYFYNNEVNQHGADNVDASKYTYPGPSPFSKETAVVMLADSIEAASRTIKDYSQDVIGALVEDIVDDKIEHGQMNHADLTFRDIETIKTIFKQKLQNIYHTRIEYPKL
ncbi:MAG: HDIG domain-containing protein [Salinivirgaceae bacterium]|nr:HDIG domain-containing protein [Salinivirgaceae bacterium]